MMLRPNRCIRSIGQFLPCCPDLCLPRYRFDLLDAYDASPTIITKPAASLAVQAHPPEARTRPGPCAHIAYCLGSRSEGDRMIEIMLAYTSSGSWRGTTPRRPLGIIEFNAAEAAKLNQRPFHIDLRCLARVPPSPDWFPDWNTPSRGVIAVAGEAVRKRVLREAERLAKSSPEIAEIRGVSRRGVK